MEIENDKDLELELDKKSDENEDDSNEENKGDGWKDKQKVPYRRLEAQSRKVQKLEEEIQTLKSLVSSKTEKVDNTKKGTWDNRVKNAQSWDEVFEELPDAFLKKLLESPEMQSKLASAVKGDLESEKGKIEERVNQEIDGLWDKDIITSKDQENRLIKYAVKESEESGEYIPLSVAVRMMKKEGIWDKKVEDRKEANNKVRPSSSGGNKNTEKSNYGAFRHESLDSIIADAASKYKSN